MRTRAPWIIGLGTAIAGCTSLLGDFTVGDVAHGVGQPDGAIATDGSDTPTDGAPDAPHGPHCALLPNSFRKVTDLKGNDAGAQGYEGVAVVSINDSATRIIPVVGGSGGDNLAVYTIRTDRPSEGANTTMVSGARPQEIHHRTAPGGAGETVILVSQNGNVFTVYSLPDNDQGAQLKSPQPLLDSPLPNNQGSRAAILPLAHGDFWGLVEYQNVDNSFTIGTVRSTNGAGTLVQSAASGPNPMSTDFINLVAIGSDVYGYNVGDIKSSVPTVQWKWPIAPDVAHPGDGVSREVGNAVLPISLMPVANGTAVQVAAGKISFDSTGNTITGIDLSTGTVPNASYSTFTLADLHSVVSLSDPDTFSFGPNGTLTAYPGHVAFLGPGSLTSSSGLNFTLIDADAGKIEFSATGTGKNLLQGNNRILKIAMDYSPPQFGTSFGFDIVWVEHKVEDAGAEYDELYYQKLQCDL
jgi:hypothetical protein